MVFWAAGWCCVGFVSVYEFGVLCGLLLVAVFGFDYGWRLFVLLCLVGVLNVRLVLDLLFWALG